MLSATLQQQASEAALLGGAMEPVLYATNEPDCASAVGLLDCCESLQQRVTLRTLSLHVQLPGGSREIRHA